MSLSPAICLPGQPVVGVAEDTRTLIDELIQEQQRLTAVERFAQQHERGALPAQARHYRALLPAGEPGAGEQYAFAVDLDACSGCKACVTACHSLNGLDEDETWRGVGLLHGGTSESPFQQTVTTSCHHCIEPACLNGCPVLAYEKDPRTGIVRHLDDQCIGCQYCILKCPYDVPKYSAGRGIVRKCDMCASRLAVGEAPACAQACPNEAIRITIVNRAEIVAGAERGEFLPGAPDPAYTLPTTRYLTKRTLPPNLAPADEPRIKPERSHPPLVIMLVLTQLSVGVFCVETLLRAIFSENLMTRLSPFNSSVAFAVGLLALAASTLHLGRPLYAWRALVGLRTSWLSREIVLFGLFAALATAHAIAFRFPRWSGFGAPAIGAAVSLSGLLGVLCSVMIYRDTRRPFWSGGVTALKFFGTTAVLGAAATLFLTTLQALLTSDIAGQGAYQQLTRGLAAGLAAASVVKLAVEAGIFRHLLALESSPLKIAAQLLAGELAEIMAGRFLMGVIGGVVLPLAFLAQQPAPGIATLGWTFGILLFVMLGELTERHLFFAAAVAPKMPGGVGG
jgi:formate dehydrogenase iron-sulfur subunit